MKYFKLCAIAFLLVTGSSLSAWQKKDIDDCPNWDLIYRWNEFLNHPNNKKELDKIKKNSDLSAFDIDFYPNEKPPRLEVKYKPKPGMTPQQKKEIENAMKELLEDFLGNFKGGLANTQRIKEIRPGMKVNPLNPNPTPIETEIRNVVEPIINGGEISGNQKEIINTVIKGTLGGSSQGGGGNVPGGPGSGGNPSGAGSGSGGGTGSGSGGGSGTGGGSGAGSGGSGGGGTGGGSGAGRGTGGGGSGNGAGNPPRIDPGLAGPLGKLGGLVNNPPAADKSKPPVDLSKLTGLLKGLNPSPIIARPPVRSTVTSSNNCCDCSCFNWAVVQYCQPVVVWVRQKGFCHSYSVPMVIYIPGWAMVPVLQNMARPAHHSATSEPPSLISSLEIPAGTGVSDAYFEGRQAFVSGQFADALQWLNYAIAGDSQHVLAWHLRALALKHMARDVEAASSARRASALLFLHPENRDRTLAGLEKFQGSDRAFLVDKRDNMTRTVSETLVKADLPPDIHQVKTLAWKGK